jgi:hypothetical protein
MTAAAARIEAEEGSGAVLQLRAAELAHPADPALWRACALEAAREGDLAISERACRALGGDFSSGVPGGRGPLLSLLATSGLRSARKREWAYVERWALLIERYGGSVGVQLPRAQLLIALWREKVGDRQRAQAAVITAVAGRRVSVEHCLAFSNELRRHRRFALAACLLEQAIADHGEQTALLLSQAAVLAELGRAREADRCWAAALARVPEPADARLLFSSARGQLEEL